MADINLTQVEADALIAMEKYRVTDERTNFPMRGEDKVLPLQSPDKQERFLLDLSRGRINLQRVKMQTRGRKVIVLVRLDLGGAPHRNPDGKDIPAPHLHIYHEDYGDKWAIPVPTDQFRSTDDVCMALEDFLRFCNVTQSPYIDWGLFT